VAPGFADIFRSNATKIGLLPVQLSDEEVRAVAAAGDAEIDLEALEVRAGGATYRFEVDAETRHRLLEGLDDIAMTLKQGEAIDAFERDRERAGPDTTALPA
jgi:3-isopropylmalate/(R)-2-methylmalate dehydratase small subunit